MSWEESELVLQRCPCGNGHYAVIHRSDDWGRFEERWVMQCARCNAVYDLYAYHTSRKGLTETHYGWVRKPVLREVRELQARTRKEEQRLATLLKTKHGTRWHRHFDGKKKNAIWAELTENGKCYPSLPTFYDHVRHSGLQKVLDRYLHYRDAETVIRVLQLHDLELTGMIKRIRAMERDTECREQHLQEEAVA